MTEDQILPMDGGEVPDDLVVRDRLVASYRNTPAPDDGAAARCIRAVLARAAQERAPEPAFARRHWVFAAAAMAAALLITVTVRSRNPAEQSEVAADNIDASTTAVAGGIQFALRLPKNLAAGANVSIVGDFNGWDSKATPMLKDQSGDGWSAKVTLLPGRHVYAYVVNGEQWVVDPLAPQIPDTGYGPANAVVVEGDTR